MPTLCTGLNDDIGEQKRLEMYRTQVVIREAEQRAYDLFLQNLVKGTSHLSLGMEAISAGFGNVFEIGPVFRANPSFTARHDTDRAPGRWQRAARRAD